MVNTKRGHFTSVIEMKFIMRPVAEQILPMDDAKQRIITMKNSVEVGKVIIARSITMKALTLLSIR